MIGRAQVTIGTRTHLVRPTVGGSHVPITLRVGIVGPLSIYKQMGVLVLHDQASRFVDRIKAEGLPNG